MSSIRSVMILGCLAAAALPAQTTTRRPFIRSTGDGTVSIRPDQARVTVGVITQGATASEATDTNATKSTAVLNALRQLLGPNADIRTTSFSVTPIQRFPAGGGVPTITGYTASNQFLVTLGDLSNAGRVIDASAGAGANSIGGISFSLRDPVPARQQALRLATQQARSNAEAIALGIGGRLGSVVSVEEGVVSRVVSVDRAAAGAAAATPVEVGNLEISASVTLEVELLQ